MPDEDSRPAARSARFSLRDATAGAHDRLDRLYSRLDLSQRSRYAAFLLSHAAAFLPVEAALGAAGAGDLVAGWRDRRRGPALLSDLAVMDLAAPQPAAAPAFESEAQILGGVYVLEGSRLGGALLVRQVGAGLPTNFLAPGNPADWRAFTSLLDERLSSGARLADAAAAAIAVFAVFERAARAHLGADRP